MTKPNKMSIPAKKDCQAIDSMWDSAIKDTEAEIRILTIKTLRLQSAVKIFRANKRDGMQWPGTKKPEELS